MTIVQLEYLIAVVNHGSFSAAAEHSFVTQPSLSIQISHLEEELGVILLDRNSKPITLTQAGLAVLEQAREAVSAFHGTKEVVNDLKGNLCGRLRLGVIPTISPYLMPKFIPEFIKHCPAVELEISDMFTSDLIEALNHDQIDIAILSGGESVVKIRETELFSDKLYLYVSPRNPLYERDVVFIEDIDIKKLLIIAQGNCLRNQTFRLCKAKEKVHSQYDFVTSSLETLMRVVDATSTMTVIPGMAIESVPEERKKQIKRFGKGPNERKITMAVGRTYVKEALIEAVRASVMTAAGEFDLADFRVG